MDEGERPRDLGSIILGAKITFIYLSFIAQLHMDVTISFFFFLLSRVLAHIYRSYVVLCFPQFVLFGL